MPKNKSNPMSVDELKELQDANAQVALQDAHLGRVLDLLASHLARLNNLDYPVKQEEDEAPAEPAEQAPAEPAPAEEAPAQEGDSYAN